MIHILIRDNDLCENPNDYIINALLATASFDCLNLLFETGPGEKDAAEPEEHFFGEFDGGETSGDERPSDGADEGLHRRTLLST